MGTWNIERFGFDAGRGHHRLPYALEWLLDQTPTPPDVLALPEARAVLNDGERAIRREFVHQLAPHLGGGWYEPFFASRLLPGRRNHLHLLLINTGRLRPLEWYDPHGPDPARRTDGYVVCEVDGHEVWFCCEHWDGGSGRGEFDRAAQRVSGRGGRRQTVLLGDFNADSGWPGELHHDMDWYAQCEATGTLHKLDEKGWCNPATGRWEVDTRQLDKLRTIYGYRDMGEEAPTPDPTPTTRAEGGGSALRIDRIFRSAGLPAQVLGYHVRQPPRDLSDHAYVFGTYRIEHAAGE